MQFLTQNKQVLYALDPANTIGQADFSDTIFIPSSGNKIVSSQFSGQSGNDSWSASQQMTLEIVSYRVLTLRAFIDLNSIQPAPYYVPELTDSDVVAAIKSNEQDALQQYMVLRLWLARAGVRFYFANLLIHNRRPGYYLNLHRFLTSNQFFEGEQGITIGFTIQDAGFGMFRELDALTIFGEVQEAYAGLDTSLQL